MAMYVMMVLVHLLAISRFAFGNMQLVKLPKKYYVERGAFCLDGSAPAFYFRAANETAEPAAKTRWVLYFKGGG